MVRLRPYWPYWLLRPCIITGEPAVKRKIVQPKQDESFTDILKSAVSVFAERFAPNPPLATGVLQLRLVFLQPGKLNYRLSTLANCVAGSARERSIIAWFPSCV